MRAAYIERPGPPEAIVVGSLAAPAPKEGQVLVRVAAAAVNPIDTYLRGGLIKAELPQPYILGCDLAGVVEAVGPGVSGFRKGDRVWGSNQGLQGRQGTFAELAAVDRRWLYPMPDEIGFDAAAALALVGITAHLGLFRDAKLKSGETVFVHGGSGGVGSCVVQMARAVGAKVVTTAGDSDKVRLCRELGAEVVIPYKTEDVDAALSEAGPIHVWFETLREQNFELAVKHLAMRGRMIVMAGRDARPPFPVGPFYVKDCAMFGFAMFNAAADEQRACAADINRWLAEGKLRPQIGRVFPLAETAEAHRLQEANTLHRAGTLMGKILVTP